MLRSRASQWRSTNAHAEKPQRGCLLSNQMGVGGNRLAPQHEGAIGKDEVSHIVAKRQIHDLGPNWDAVGIGAVRQDNRGARPRGGVTNPLVALLS